jgi:endonuclease YncB( thermonuclease family)
MTRWLIALLSLATLAACSTTVELPQATSTGAAPTTVASVNFPSATVVYVGDGDTMGINYQGETVGTTSAGVAVASGSVGAASKKYPAAALTASGVSPSAVSKPSACRNLWTLPLERLYSRQNADNEVFGMGGCFLGERV